VVETDPETVKGVEAEGAEVIVVDEEVVGCACRSSRGRGRGREVSPGNRSALANLGEVIAEEAGVACLFEAEQGRGQYLA
jgi:hypothetical protein